MPFTLLALIAINIGLAIVGRLLAPRLKSTRPADLNVPTSEEGAPIPVFWGVVEIAPNTVWAGHVLKRKKGTAWRWYAAMHHIFGFGVVNEVIDLSWDDKSARNQNIQHPTIVSAPFPLPVPAVIAGPLVNAGSPVTIDVHGDSYPDSNDSGSMFGGNQQGGGVSGTLVVYWGTDGQPIDPYLSLPEAYGASDPLLPGPTHFPNNCSRWPRICYMRMGGGDVSGTAPFYVGANSATPAPFRAVLRRTAWWETTLSPLGQDAATATLGYDASVPEILYDMLTSKVYGLGLAPSRIDLASFISCAAALAAEVITDSKTGFGLSVLVSQPEEAGRVVRQILDHVDASLEIDPRTGLLRLKLIRDDYDPLTIPQITESNSWDFTYAPATWAETVNEVRLTYRTFVNTTERRGFVDAVASAHDDANFASTGRLRTLTADFPFITDPDIAQLVCERLRRARGIPLAKCSWSMNREGYSLMEGDVVSVTAPAFGVSGLVLRILKVNYGSLTEGAIQIDAVQDVFSVARAVYGAPPASGWAEPIGNSGLEPTGSAGPTSGTEF